MKDRRTLYIFCTLALLQVGDVLSTFAALHNPAAYEANSAMRSVVQLPLALQFAIKLLPLLPAYALFRYVEGKRSTPPPSAIYIPFLCAIGIYAYVLTKNSAIYLGGFQ